MGFCKICDIRDWQDEEFLSILDELQLSFGRERQHRKHWEFGWAIKGLRALGCLTPDAMALGVGAGHEHPMYYLANVIQKVHATDIYGTGDFVETDSSANMLIHPEKYAPFPYREDHLVTQYMDGCDLKYPDAVFDIVFSFSSIEHFGGHKAASRSMKEMARVLKPGGVLALTTELVLNNLSHSEFFLADEVQSFLVKPSGLQLLEDIDFTISPSLMNDPVDLATEHLTKFPNIVCKVGNHLFTSVLLFLRKPALDAAKVNVREMPGRINLGEPVPEQLQELQRAVAEKDAEIARLRAQVAAYENGRFIRFMRALSGLWRRSA
ncbi:MAG: methyltransferase domain-containing protein [Anaerolineae bacterium]|nr:methyltransferase domain-containing protein [Anaerolineae bacterium]